jgi:hypothetical protein
MLLFLPWLYLFFSILISILFFFLGLEIGGLRLIGRRGGEETGFPKELGRFLTCMDRKREGGMECRWKVDGGGDEAGAMVGSKECSGEKAKLWWGLIKVWVLL